MSVYNFIKFKKRKKINKLILRLTYRIWRPLTSSVLSYAYERRFIDSRAFHLLNACFDRTQEKSFGNPEYLLRVKK